MNYYNAIKQKIHTYRRNFGVYPKFLILDIDTLNKIRAEEYEIDYSRILGLKVAILECTTDMTIEVG